MVVVVVMMIVLCFLGAWYIAFDYYLFVVVCFEQQNFGIRTAGLEEKATACQMLVCYARELKEGFAEYTEQVVKIMVAHLKFYFHDGKGSALFAPLNSVIVSIYFILVVIERDF